MLISRFLAGLHLRLVPFPIVLLLRALLLDTTALVWRKEKLHQTAKWLLCAGTASLLLAFICGICAEIWAGRAGVPNLPIEVHELAATVAAWGFLSLTSWRLFLDGTRRGAMLLFVISGLTLYAMLGLTGYLGGKLVTDYGAAVTGATAKTILSGHDLNT